MRRIGFLFVVLALSACGKPKVGDKCENGKRVCDGTAASLYCANGSYQADTCKGPKGCVEDKGVATCDVTGNVEGDTCPAAFEGQTTCRSDRKSRVICKGGKYVVEACRGAEGCTMEGPGKTTCDRGPAQAGESCGVQGYKACAVDGKSALLCKSGKYELAQKCPGPNGCKEISSGVVTCDPNGPFSPGDACFFITASCSADNKSEMACENGVFVVKRQCGGPKGCKGVECDTGYAEEGDECEPKGATACSNDKKSLLTCKNPPKIKASDVFAGPAWIVEKTCKTSCTPKDGQLVCD